MKILVSKILKNKNVCTIDTYIRIYFIAWYYFSLECLIRRKYTYEYWKKWTTFVSIMKFFSGIYSMVLTYWQIPTVTIINWNIWILFLVDSDDSSIITYVRTYNQNLLTNGNRAPCTVPYMVLKYFQTFRSNVRRKRLYENIMSDHVSTSIMVIVQPYSFAKEWDVIVSLGADNLVCFYFTRHDDCFHSMYPFHTCHDLFSFWIVL